MIAYLLPLALFIAIVMYRGNPWRIIPRRWKFMRPIVIRFIAWRLGQRSPQIITPLWDKP